MIMGIRETLCERTSKLYIALQVRNTKQKLKKKSVGDLKA